MNNRRLRIFLMSVLMCIVTGQLSAQTWEEWFRQKRTQRKYLIQQIAALKVYLGYLNEGYDIAEKGLNTIGDIKDGNFNSHSDYFRSLQQVNFSVGNSSKVATTIEYQNFIITDFRNLLNECQSTGYLTPEEKNYVQEVYANLLKNCEEAFEELKRVITVKELEMKDDERMIRIDAIYYEMKDRYAFGRSFSNSTRMLIMQRAHEEFELNKSGTITSTF